MLAMLGWFSEARTLGFTLEAGQAVGISRKGVGEDLEGDIAVELRVGGLPDLAHPALTEEGSDVVVPEAGAGGQGHGLLGPNGSFYAQAVHGSSVGRGIAGVRRLLRGSGRTAQGALAGLGDVAETHLRP